MPSEAYVIFIFISFLVVGAYLYIKISRQKRRRLRFERVGLKMMEKAKRKEMWDSLRINSKAMVSESFGARLYASSDVNGRILVCDMTVSVVGGFFQITVFGFFSDFDEIPDFTIRKRNLLETRFELRGARMLKNKWFMWCSSAGHQGLDFDGVARRLERFGNAAILTKKKEILRLYFRGKHLHEDKVIALLPQWRRFCSEFEGLILKTR